MKELDGDCEKRENVRTENPFKGNSLPGALTLPLQCDSQFFTPDSLGGEARMQIDAGRLRRSIEAMARVGATPSGGVHRLALSDADKEARDLFGAWAKEAGLSLTVDEMGNMFARREGGDKDAPPAAAGSHLDTVPNGGRFDGAYGVLSALEAVRSLNDQNISTRRPVEIINWTNEEGARFPIPMIASSVFSGLRERDAAYEVCDSDGKRFADALERIGYRGEVPCRPRPLGSFLEIHVEQGPVLITEGTQIGVVDGIRGLRWMRFTFHGVRDHAGPTPMDMRRDALVGAAKVIAAVREIPRRTGTELVTTVGEIHCVPNIVNVIPDRVSFTVDFRDIDPIILAQTETIVREAATKAKEEENLGLDVDTFTATEPLAFDPIAISAVENACVAARFSYKKMTSAAGHDAHHLAEICPTSMIFVPSEGGKSHAEDERTSWEDLARGAEVLAGALLALANRP
jgi:N-carbamoyl-L-amino-acid hydrolase